MIRSRQGPASGDPNDKTGKETKIAREDTAGNIPAPYPEPSGRTGTGQSGSNDDELRILTPEQVDNLESMGKTVKRLIGTAVQETIKIGAKVSDAFDTIVDDVRDIMEKSYDDRDMMEKGYDDLLAKPRNIEERESPYKNFREEFYADAEKYSYLYELLSLSLEADDAGKYQDAIFEWEQVVKSSGGMHTIEKWQELNQKHFTSEWFGGIPVDESAPQADLGKLRSFVQDWIGLLFGLGLKHYTDQKFTLTCNEDKRKFVNVYGLQVGASFDVMFGYWYFDEEGREKIIAKGTAWLK